MRRNAKSQGPRMPQPPAPKMRILNVQLTSDTAELLDDIAATLGISPQEAVERGLAILMAEITKQALIMPAWIDGDDDEEDDED